MPATVRLPDQPPGTICGRKMASSASRRGQPSSDCPAASTGRVWAPGASASSPDRRMSTIVSSILAAPTAIACRSRMMAMCWTAMCGAVGMPASRLAPDGFPTGASFSLTSREAQFLRERIVSQRPGTMLAFLVDHGRPCDSVELPLGTPAAWRNVGRRAGATAACGQLLGEHVRRLAALQSDAGAKGRKRRTDRLLPGRVAGHGRSWSKSAAANCHGGTRPA